MPFTPYALEILISEKNMKLTKCGATDVSQE